MNSTQFAADWHGAKLFSPAPDISRNIEERGFVHIRQFLTNSEVALLRSAFESSGSHESTAAIKWFSRPSLPASMVSKLRHLQAQCLPGIRLANVGAFYFRVNADPASESVSFPWHVDHESWYLYGQHRKYLNVWIAIDKSSPASANLSIVPHDRLRHADSQIASLVEGHGAIWAGKGCITFDAMPRRLEWDGDLDQLSVTPQMNSGDALVLRGDVFHRTQDRLSDRTALSFRCVDLDHVIDVSHYYPASRAHLKGLLEQAAPYAASAFLFRKAQTTRLSVDELLEAAKRISKHEDRDATKSEFEQFLTEYQCSLRNRLGQAP